MHTIHLTDDQKSIQAAARRFASSVIRPAAAKHDADGSFPRDIVSQAAELGLLYATIPEENGGVGVDYFTETLIVEEISWGCAGVGSTWVIGDLVIAPLALFGSNEQKKRFLTPMAEDDKLACFCLSEPRGGSDIANLSTTATRKDDSYVLNGSKQWITTSGSAEFFLVFATADKKAREQGLTAFLVEKDTPGLEVGRKEDTLGMRCSGTRQVFFNECVVPACHRLGEERQGFSIARAAMLRSRIQIAAMSTGIARAAMEHATRYALERSIADKPLATYQSAQLKLANMAQDVYASRLMTQDAARRVDQGSLPERESSMAKCFASDAATRVTTEAVQMFGGYGTTRDYPVEKLFRDAKMMQVVEGTNEVLRLIVATETITAAIREE